MKDAFRYVTCVTARPFDALVVMIGGTPEIRLPEGGAAVMQRPVSRSDRGPRCRP